MQADRRHFLRTALAVSAGFAGAGPLGRVASATVPRWSRFGPLLPDPDGILDLPAGFKYRVLSRLGDRMDDGLTVPGLPDGMAAFPGPGERVILVRNHELTAAEPGIGPFGTDDYLFERVPRRRVFDPGNGRTPSQGGTTTLVYDPASGEVENQFLSLAGTERNCAGGTTPWNAWLTCEENTRRAGVYQARRALPGEHVTVFELASDHGWVFEVPATADGGLEKPRPLKGLGRFQHEAAGVDPRTGIVYLTEDRPDSLLYRFVPTRPGRLHGRGRLQALAITGAPGRDTRNWPQATRLRSESGAAPPQPHFEAGRSYPVSWVDLDDVTSPDDSLRFQGREKGAAVFARGEGLWIGNGEVWFAATTGGAITAGQIFCYRPGAAEGGKNEAGAPGSLTLFLESADASVMENVDNVVVAPWGDLLMCEDTSGEHCSLLGATPGGRIYTVAHNAYDGNELAGACFSPDGRTLFVNIQGRHLTLAVTGPWPA